MCLWWAACQRVKQEYAFVAAAGRAVSLALAVHWVFNYGIGQLFLPAVDAVGVSGVYLVFALVCAFTVVFANTQIPETKGKSLDEIEAEMKA